MFDAEHTELPLDSTGDDSIVKLDESEVPEPSTDADLHQLLIAIGACSVGRVVENNDQPTPAQKLYRAIIRVVQAKRRQFVNYRLQWLVLSYTRKPPVLFQLPESISSPRMVHDVKTREAWWYHARGHSDDLRKKIKLGYGCSKVPSYRRSSTFKEPKTLLAARVARDVELSRARAEPWSPSNAKEVGSAASKLRPHHKSLTSMDMPTVPLRARSESILTIKDPGTSKMEQRAEREARLFDVPHIPQCPHISAKTRMKNHVTKVQEYGAAVVFLNTVLDREENLADIEIPEVLSPNVEIPSFDAVQGEASSVAVDNLERERSGPPNIADIFVDVAGGFEHSCLSENAVDPHEPSSRYEPIPANVKVMQFGEEHPLDSSRPVSACMTVRSETQLSPGDIQGRRGSRSRRVSLSVPILNSTTQSQQEAETTSKASAKDLPKRKSLRRFGLAAQHELDPDDRDEALDTLKRVEHIRKGSSETDAAKVTPVIRWEVARGFSGVKDLPPPVMAPPSLTKDKSDKPQWHPFNFKRQMTMRDRTRSASKSKDFKETGIAISDRHWSDDFAKECLEVPKATVKIPPDLKRQHRIDQAVDHLLSSKITREKKLEKAGLMASSSRNVTFYEKYPVRSTGLPGVIKSRSPEWICHAPSVNINNSAPYYEDPVHKVTKRPSTVTKKAPAGAANCKKAAYAYLEGVVETRRLPFLPKCLQVVLQPDSDSDSNDDAKRAAYALDFRNLNLTDNDARPLIQGLGEHRMSFDAMILAGNPRLSDAIHLKLFMLVAERSKATGVRIQRLDLSGATNIGEKSLQFMGNSLKGELRELKVLRMDGIIVTDRVWSQVFQSCMVSLRQLEELSFVDMQLGRTSQVGTVVVAELIPHMHSLTSLDISSNFFSFQGCKALANNIRAHPCLAKLDVSYNAGGFVPAVGGFSTANHSSIIDTSSHGGSHSAGVQSFNPISLLCEGVAKAPALKWLNLATCHLNYDEDFILEDALAEKVGVGMEHLDVSGNPCQGRMGARSLLRLAIATTTLTTLDVREFREALPPEKSIPFEYTDPSSFYDLDLSYPQHRAFLRALVRRCKALREDPTTAFKFEGPGMPALGESALKSILDGSGGPDSGNLTFRYTMPSIVQADEEDIADLMGRVQLRRKINVSLYAFVRIASLFENACDVYSRSVLVGAIASDVLMKLCHVRYLAQLDYRVHLSVIEQLIPAVHNLDRNEGFDLIMTARGSSAKPMHIACVASLRVLLFNPFCASGHYELNMGNASDRHTLEQLLIVNEWERKRAIAKNHPDLSQHGGHECMRNVSFNGLYMIWESEKNAMPSRGEMTFDFCSPFHPSIDTQSTDDTIIEQIVQALTSSVVDPAPRMAVLRTIVHHLFLTAAQCARLIKTLPGSIRVGEDHHAIQSNVRSSPRVDAFVALYMRCIEVSKLLSMEPGGLYGMELLTRMEVLHVRVRLGRLRSWDITRMDQIFLVPVPGSGGTYRERMEKAHLDSLQMAGTLRGLGLRDDVTSHGNANRYVLDLTVFEDHQLAFIMMQVGMKEGGAHFDEPQWSETAHLEERGTKWLVPGEWNVQVPEVGIFSVRYFLERDSNRDTEFRKEMAARYLGWSQSQENPELIV